MKPNCLWCPDFRPERELPVQAHISGCVWHGDDGLATNALFMLASWRRRKGSLNPSGRWANRIRAAMLDNTITWKDFNEGLPFLPGLRPRQRKSRAARGAAAVP